MVLLCFWDLFVISGGFNFLFVFICLFVCFCWGFNLGGMCFVGVVVVVLATICDTRYV